MKVSEKNILFFSFSVIKKFEKACYHLGKLNVGAFFCTEKGGTALQSQTQKERHAEGELYKTVELHGRTFTLYYGYYEECDRQNPLCEPIVIYPDFLNEPVYTDDGEPFATMVQDACDSYVGEGKRTLDSTCADCKHFRCGEDWIGICVSTKNKK